MARVGRARASHSRAGEPTRRRSTRQSRWWTRSRVCSLLPGPAGGSVQRRILPSGAVALNDPRPKVVPTLT